MEPSGQLVEEYIRSYSTIGPDCEGRIADFTKGKLVRINSGEPKRRRF
ncbi:hypothetical protein ABEY41_15965 [Peribacillus butanolivorans]